MMKFNKGEDFVKKLIAENKLSSKVTPIANENDLKDRLKTINKDATVNKLRELGLGNVADQLKSIPDDELIRMISKNPGLLKKINSFLK